MQKNKKMIIGGVAVASCIAAGAIYAVEANESQFGSDNLKQSDFAYMAHTAKYNIHHKTKAEYKMRQARYEKVDGEINAHNADPQTTSECGHNYMSDYTESMLKNMKGYKGTAPTKNFADYEDVSGKHTDVEVDWFKSGKVTPVQNQGQCGSCWTFSASGAISSARAIKDNTAPVDYSEQQIVDCDKTGNGCSGGLMDLAFTYVETHPLELSTDYPYKAANGTCTYNAAKGTGAISSYKNVQVKKQKNGKLSVHPFKAALALGPVSVGVAASSTAFQQYKTGILSKGCGTQVDHGILAVGWGKLATNGHEYILVKNQWGATWGEKGFIMIDIHNTCEILSNASYPIV